MCNGQHGYTFNGCGPVYDTYYATSLTPVGASTYATVALRLFDALLLPNIIRDGPVARTHWTSPSEAAEMRWTHVPRWLRVLCAVPVYTLISASEVSSADYALPYSEYSRAVL